MLSRMNYLHINLSENVSLRIIFKNEKLDEIKDARSANANFILYYLS
jgi:hypothetical protein